VRVETRTDARPEVRVDRQNMIYTKRATQLGRVTSSVGLSISTVPPAMAAQLRLEPGVGVVVEEVSPGSAIEAAGIEQYDVIEKVDHRSIHRAQELTQAIRDAHSDSVSLDIVRQAHRQTLNVDRNGLRRGNGISSNAFGSAGGGVNSRSGGKEIQAQRGKTDTFAFSGIQSAGGGMDFRADGKDIKADHEQADRDREQRERDREQRDRDREQAQRDRENAKRDQKNTEHQQIDALREQIKAQLDRERGEIDRAREQLNRAAQEMNKQLSQLRAKIDSELKEKLEAELRKGQDQIREKMQLLEEQGRELQSDDSKGDEKK
jgi:hypothetical protein